MFTTQSPESGSQYRPDIDGLRAVAILSVVLYHTGLPWAPGGFTGVDIFFVISGFLIGGQVFSDLSAGTFSFFQFYKRRAKRILPAFYGVLAFSLLAALILLSPLEARSFAKMALASIFSVSNVYLVRTFTYFQSASELNPLLMTWSLSVEEQFYAVMPLLMLGVVRLRRNMIIPSLLLLSTLSFAFAWGGIGSHPNLVFYSLPSRAWELGVGVTLAVLLSTRRGAILPGSLRQGATWLGLICVVTPLFLLTSNTPFPGPAALPSVLGTALLIAVPTSWFNRRVLGSAPLTFIGKISYSWYLWHWPFLSFMRMTAGGQLPRSAIACSVVLSFAAAVVSYRVIEQPFRVTSLQPIPLLLRYAGVGVFLASLFMGLWLDQGIPGRYPTLAQEGERTSDPCLVSYGASKPNLSSRCYNANDSRPSVVLWGDSHAASLAPALRRLATLNGYNFVQLTRSSCLPLMDKEVIGPTPSHPLNAGECLTFNNHALHLVLADQRARVVILAGRWGNGFFGDDARYIVRDETLGLALRRSLISTTQTLEAKGIRIIFIADVPNFRFDASARFRTSHMAVRRMLAELLGEQTDNFGRAPDGHPAADDFSTAILNQVTRASPRVVLYDPKSILCNQQHLCSYSRRDELLYSDDQHLTQTGAQFALQNFHLPLVETSLPRESASRQRNPNLSLTEARSWRARDRNRSAETTARTTHGRAHLIADSVQ